MKTMLGRLLQYQTAEGTTITLGVLIIMQVLLTGCGVSEQEHQKVLGQLTAAKQELVGISGDLESAIHNETALESKVSSATTKIPSLKRQLETLNRRSAELTAKIAQLETQEPCVFQKAGALLDAQDLQGALQAYKAFVDKFPQSYRVTSANEIITGIERKLGTYKQ